MSNASVKHQGFKQELTGGKMGVYHLLIFLREKCRQIVRFVLKQRDDTKNISRPSRSKRLILSRSFPLTSDDALSAPRMFNRALCGMPKYIFGLHPCYRELQVRERGVKKMAESG